MTTPLENPIPMPSKQQSKVFWTVVAIAIVAIVATLTMNAVTKSGSLESEPAQGATSVKAVQGTPAAPLLTGKPADMRPPMIIGEVSGLTFNPGKARAFRQFTGSIDRKSISSDWWLYARSEEESKWLDFYGYPTPSQHAKLKALSGDELRALADAGDANAKAHLSTRAMVAVFEKQDLKSVDRTRYELEQLVANGSPYNAMTVMQRYGDLINAFQSTPEEQRTEAQREILTKLGGTYYIAYLRGLLYSDDTINDMKANVAGRDLGQWSNAGTSKDIYAESFLMGLRATANRRADEGLPPLVITPRPKPPAGDRPIYLERQ